MLGISFCLHTRNLAILCAIFCLLGAIRTWASNSCQSLLSGNDQVALFQSLQNIESGISARAVPERIILRYWDSAEAIAIAKAVAHKIRNSKLDYVLQDHSIAFGVPFETETMSGELDAYIREDKKLTINFSEVRFRKHMTGEFMDDGDNNGTLSLQFTKVMAGFFRSLHEVKQNDPQLQSIVVHSNAANPRLKTSLEKLGFTAIEKRTSNNERYWFVRGEWTLTELPE